MLCNFLDPLINQGLIKDCKTMKFIESENFLLWIKKWHIWSHDLSFLICEEDCGSCVKTVSWSVMNHSWYSQLFFPRLKTSPLCKRELPVMIKAMLWRDYWHVFVSFCRCRRSSRARRWHWPTTEPSLSKTSPCSPDWSTRKSSLSRATAVFRRSLSLISFASPP